MAAFSGLPGGSRLHYLTQRFVTHSLPLNDAGIRQQVTRARRHLELLQEHRPRDLASARFYEFGVGWDFGIPLAFYGLGVNHQVAIDIRRLATEWLIGETAERLNHLRLTQRPVSSDLGKLGIDYRAPCDARDTGLPAESVDCITSTAVLEHIPTSDIPAILAECRRLLRPDGVASFLIDYQDHYSYVDESISRYNFLRFSAGRWRCYNPALHFQNRLRHPQYLQLFAENGFRVADCHAALPSSVDLQVVGGLGIDVAFQGFGPQELAIQDAWVVLEPK